MKTKPILFSAPMVRAILAGRKTQTRRILSPANCTVLGNRARGRKDPLWAGLDFSRATIRTQSTLMVALCGQDAPYDLHLRVPWRHPDDPAAAADDCFYRVRPIYAPGDLLWVRETWSHTGTGVWSASDAALAHDGSVIYRATDAEPCAGAWFPSIRMPRWASRITLEVTAVRLQRLQEISAEDAEAEGLWYCDSGKAAGFWFADPSMQGPWGDGTVECFMRLWEEIHGPGAWEENPEVVAVSFRPHLVNVDRFVKKAA